MCLEDENSMDFTLDKSKTKILKIIIGVFTAIWSIIFTWCLWVLFSFSKEAFTEPATFFPVILAFAIYMNAFRFFKMVKDNNGSISINQLKVWSMLFVRGIFASCLYLAIYAMNIFGIIFFSLTFLATFFCNHYLKKAIDIERQNRSKKLTY